MIRKYPGRTLGVIALVTLVLFALSYPGRNDRHGAWMYVSGISWIAFLLGAVVLVVLGIYAAATRKHRRPA
jgi:hypothetical protein